MESAVEIDRLPIDLYIGRYFCYDNILQRFGSVILVLFFLLLLLLFLYECVLILLDCSVNRARGVCRKWKDGVEMSIGRRKSLSFAGWKMKDDSTARLIRHEHSLRELDL